MNHTCHWPGCNTAVAPKLWGCKAHWFRLPKHLRDRIWTTYRPGQEVDKRPSKAYLGAAQAVQDWIRAQEGVALLPCPFCGGPPVPIVQLDIVGGAAPVLDDYGDGLHVSAFVFCHECGADGPHHDTLIFDSVEYRAAEAEGVRLWQLRDSRHRSMFDAGAAEGLNRYPRTDT